MSDTCGDASLGIGDYLTAFFTSETIEGISHKKRAEVAKCQAAGGREPDAEGLSIGDKNLLSRITYSSGPIPRQVFAPYVDVLLGDFDQFKLYEHADTVGYYFTLAFIVGAEGGGCRASWGGKVLLDQDLPLLRDIVALKEHGGDIIISFGGADGSDLAQRCTSEDALLEQYQAVVNRYALQRIDLDVEGAAALDKVSVQRRNGALARLKAFHPSLQIQYTLPVMPEGLTEGGLAILRDATAHKLTPDRVNVMAMDYGIGSQNMGKSAKEAMTQTVRDLKRIFPGKKNEEYWAMIGVTPMIGVNDTKEVFQVADARALLDFAREKNISLISMWSANRDHPCAEGVNALYQCTQVSDPPLAFSKVFHGFLSYSSAAKR